MQPPPIHLQPGWRGAINLAAWKNSRRLWEAVQANSGRRYKPCRRLTRFTFTLRLEIFREREKKKTEKEKKIHRSESQTFRTSTRLFYQPKWVTEREFSFWPWSRFSIFFRLSSSSWSIQKKKKFTRESFPRMFKYIFLEEVIIRIRSTRAITGLFTQLFFLLFHRLHTCKRTIINSRRIDIRCVYIIYNRERKLRLR